MFQRSVQILRRQGLKRNRLISYRVDTPSQLIIGGNTVETSLSSVAKSLGMTRPLIVTDKFLTKTGKVNILEDALKKENMSYGIFDDVVPDPSDIEVLKGTEMYKNGGFDGIIGFGGGSPIDTAKAIGVLSANPGSIRNFKFPNPIPVRGPPVIAIPTTAGTGSECTKVTIITDTENQEKMLILGPYITPAAAIVDYTFTLTCPRRLTADTAIDSITHAVEAYVSKKASPFTDSIALTAMSTIQKNIRVACEDPQNHEARQALMFGACIAGLAFTNSSVCLVHGMSRPLGAFFHIPHGLSNAMLLPKITEFSIPSAETRYADCARAMGLVNLGDSNSKACKALVREFNALNMDLDVPNIKEFGVDEQLFNKVLETMADQALASGSPGNNPLVPTHEEICELYREIYDYQAGSFKN